MKYGLTAREGVLLPLDGRVISTLPRLPDVSAVAASGVVIHGMLEALLLGTEHYLKIARL